MSITFFTVALALLLPADTPSQSETTRKPNPFAPSLPQLTSEEEEKIDQAIERFIQFDMGKLRGQEGKQALKEFQKLSPETIPALIRGLNRAAKIETSCPAVTIARKLHAMLMASKDTQLLEYARENIGAGVTQSRHMGVIQDLRVACMLRKGALAREAVAMRANPGPRSVRTMTVTELAQMAGSERGAKQKQALRELGQRTDDQALAALGSAASSYDEEIQKLARDLLHRYLSRSSAAVLKEKLKDERPEVRAAAARVIGTKRLKLGWELIDLLSDEEADVRQAARQGLVRLSGGKDFGPEPASSDNDRDEAIGKWRDWWSKQGDR